jgi:hypothetical protein
MEVLPRLRWRLEGRSPTAALAGIRPGTANRHLADLRAKWRLTTEQLIDVGRLRARLVVPSLELEKFGSDEMDGW